MEKKLTEELLENEKQTKTSEELPDDVLDNVAGGYILRIADSGNNSSLRAAGCVRVCGIDSDDNSPLAAAAGPCNTI